MEKHEDESEDDSDSEDRDYFDQLPMLKRSSKISSRIDNKDGNGNGNGYGGKITIIPTNKGSRKEIEQLKLEKRSICLSMVNQIINNALEMAERKFIRLYKSTYSNTNIFGFEKLAHPDEFEIDTRLGKSISNKFVRLI